MPLREIKRLRTLDRFLSLQFENEKEVRDLVRLAAEVCHAKIATITILDNVAPHFHYLWGPAPEDTRWTDAFRNASTASPCALFIKDTLLDSAWAAHPSVLGSPFIRSFANIPLLTHDAYHIGSLCVFSDDLLLFSETQRSMLNILAKQIIQLFELQASIILLKEQLADIRLYQIRLTSFFNSKLVLHLLLDTNYGILSYNAVFQDLVKENCAKIPKEGDDIRGYLQQQNAATFLKNYMRALRGKQTAVRIDTVKNRASVHWLVYFEPAFDPQGGIIGVSCNALDITQKIQQESQLTQQNEDLRRVTFYQSHELRRPVSSILGIAEYLSEKFGKDMPEEIAMLKLSTRELDEKIKNIVKLTDFKKK
ncbi:GAF domain-containing protein [Sphingobacterium griseoflavum]|uniref:PAC domain-containing protein n=1 Tax=Sphingobacterium griseoflavum TaxID=1474952 RepID=A0ABQ3HTG3_9SPHI|nr:GAF domain-containing protein [Sphingobacterium griseoflavum]GHE33185.1 hypothetical protein GCM10017764_15330 [Sphingobacterium griseoflavum]